MIRKIKQEGKLKELQKKQKMHMRYSVDTTSKKGFDR